MADNLTTQTTVATIPDATTIATDDIGGAHYQRVKLSLGANGTAVDAGAGSGAAGTDTQRVILATDDPAVASLAVMDDWDESDRVKVNPIVGQAGIAAGAGAVGTTVPRVTLASDDPAVASLSVLDDWDEINRAAVNLIAGQVAVAGGAGAVGATVQRVVHGSSSGLTTTQNALSTSAEEVLAANSARLFAEVKNTDASISIYLGDDTNVTTGNGHLLKAGESFGFENYTGAIWAIAASATPTVTTIEW